MKVGYLKISQKLTYYQQKHWKNFELEQIEKSENVSFGYETIILEKRLLSVFVNTWCDESILFCGQIDFVR